MKIIAELHTHSNDYCGHAYTSVDEYAELAKAKGIKYLASTNHGPMLDKQTPTSFYMCTNKERHYEGLNYLAGIEADMRDLHGGLDLAQCDLLALDFVIVSMHSYVMPTSFDDYTGSLIAVTENPAVDCLGHIARDPSYTYDLEKVLRAVKDNRKLVEFNSWTVVSTNRKDACMKVMNACAELGVECVVTSDAHSADRFGEFTPILELIEETKFPKELIVNADEAKMAEFLSRRKAEKEAARAALYVI